MDAVINIPQDLRLAFAMWLALMLICVALLIAVGIQAFKAQRFHSPTSEINLGMVTRHRAHPYMARSERLKGLVTA